MVSGYSDRIAIQDRPIRRSRWHGEADDSQRIAEQLDAGKRLPIPPAGVCAGIGGGGSFTTLSLSRHSTTHTQIVDMFLDVQISVTQTGGDQWLVEIAPRNCMTNG